MTAGSFDPAHVLFVVGMRREAQILGPGRQALVGAGALAAAIAQRRPSAVISFGLCGALSAALTCGDLVMATRVLDGAEAFEADGALSRRLSVRLAHAVHGPMLGSAAIVGEARDKAALASLTGAIAVDMESHLVARAAKAAGAPFAVVRAVSDRAADTLPRAAQAGFRPDGAVDVPAVIAALIRRPWELPALVATAQGAGAGFRALEGASHAIGESALL